MSTKTIFVTGGNRSIGFGIVQRLVQRSAINKIIIASRQRSDAEKAIEELQNMGYKAPFFPISLELTDDDSIRNAVAEVDQKFGKLDGPYLIFDFLAQANNKHSPNQQRRHCHAGRLTRRLPQDVERNLQCERILRSHYFRALFALAPQIQRPTHRQHLLGSWIV